MNADQTHRVPLAENRWAYLCLPGDFNTVDAERLGGFLNALALPVIDGSGA